MRACFSINKCEREGKGRKQEGADREVKLRYINPADPTLGPKNRAML